MGVGYCYVAERRDGGLNLGDITVSLSEAGIQLANPTNGVITRLNESGDQIGTIGKNLNVVVVVRRDGAL